MNAGDVIRNLYSDVQTLVDRARISRATAQGVADSSGLITILRPESQTNDLEHYARLQGFATADQNDLLIAETTGGGTVVLGVLQRAVPAGYKLDSWLTFTGTVPVVTAGAAAGSTGAISSTGGVDANFAFTVTPGGTGIAAGAIASVVFGTARTDNYNVVFTNRTAASGGLLFYLTNRSGTGFTINCTVALTSGTAYAIGYFAPGF